MSDKILRRKKPSFSSSATLVVYAILGIILLAYLVVPLANLTPAIFARQDFIGDFSRPEVLSALGVSFLTASISACIAAFFGIPLAYLLARRNFRGKSLVSMLVVLPLVMPPLISGTTILLAFSSAGISHLVTQSLPGIILAQLYVASPFMVISSRVALEGVDENYEKMSRVLGKSEFETFRRITLPLAKSGIIAGFVLTWIRALGEFGATLIVSYSPHTISIQAWQDYLSGGIYYAIPDVILVVLVAIGVLSLIELSGTDLLFSRAGAKTKR
ncbi:MAG TPA: ABC transporter permease [Nitrososphaera sp.]|nr:ABC transporter permease [Nitrososphaera sp.]